jgi:MFS family permease
MLLGSLASGHLAGVYGRKRIIVIGAFAQLSFAFLFIFADSLQLILFFRFL